MLAVLVAAAAGSLYVALSLLLGERYPFSRYGMYSKIGDRTAGAVPYFRAGERFVAAQDVQAVAGLDVDALDPTRVPCSMQRVAYEAQRWFRAHASDGPIAGGVPFEAGYRLLEVAEDGTVSERLLPVTSGTARLGR